MAQTNRYIDDVDLTESTSLTHLLDRHSRDSDIDETHIIRHSPYYSETKFKQLISNKAGICILDLNVQNVYRYRPLWYRVSTIPKTKYQHQYRYRSSWYRPISNYLKLLQFTGFCFFYTDHYVLEV